MCDNMEESVDVCARRKLEFRSLPFKNKSFYVDVKSKAVKQRVEGYICNLGGSIETFLSNDIHVFVSDSRPATKRPRRGETTIQHGDLSSAPTSNSQALPLSRGRALLLKARKNTSENLTSEVNSVSNIQDKATEMGLKIEHVHSFIKRCKELGATNKQQVPKESQGDFVPIKWEDKCFIKVEDDSCQYKPLHKRLENIPLLYPDNGGGSPFDGAVVLVRPTPGSTVRREKKVSRFYQSKGGYCEMCQAWYKDTLKRHAKSSGHQKFVRNKENFVELDKIIRKLPNLVKFLFKYIPTRTVDKIPCYNSDATPVTSPELQPSSKDVYDFDGNISVNKGNADSDLANVITGDSEKPNHTVSTFHAPLTNDSTTAPDIDTPPGHATTPSTTFIEQTAFNEKDNRLEAPVFDDLDNCDMLSGLLGHPVAGAKMFSEASDADSQTSVLKNLIDGLSLQNEAAPSQSADAPSPMEVNTPREHTVSVNPSQENAVSVNLSQEHILTVNRDHEHRSQSSDIPSPMSVNTPEDKQVVVNAPQEHASQSMTSCPIPAHSEHVAAVTLARELMEETPMSTASPLHVPIVTDKVPTPGQTKLKFKLGAESSPNQKPAKTKRRRKEKNKCVYLSQKTSDTKLKLCKIVVTPVTQTSNLKMFWKVRKTGDCRLVFSSEKRKRSVPDDNFIAAADEIMSPLRANDVSPRRKRQRLVF